MKGLARHLSGHHYVGPTFVVVSQIPRAHARPMWLNWCGNGATRGTLMDKDSAHLRGIKVRWVRFKERIPYSREPKSQFSICGNIFCLAASLLDNRFGVVQIRDIRYIT